MQHFTSHLPVLCMKSHLNVTKSSEKAIFETTGMSQPACGLSTGSEGQIETEERWVGEELTLNILCE